MRDRIRWKGLLLVQYNEKLYKIGIYMRVYIFSFATLIFYTAEKCITGELENTRRFVSINVDVSVVNEL